MCLLLQDFIIGVNCHFIIVQLVLMQASKRPSLPSPSSRTTSHHPSQRLVEAALDSERIEKYIEFIKVTLKTRLRDKNFAFEENQLKELHKLVKAVQHYHSKSQRESQESIVQLQARANFLQAEQDKTTAALKLQLAEQMQERQRQWSQQLLAINNDNGRKEQAYKETIEKLMNALASAQKSLQQLHLKLNCQMQTVAKALQNLSATQRRDHCLSNAIRDLVEEIALRQENSLISSKSADELSLEQIDLPLSQPPREQTDSAVGLDTSEASLEKQLQGWLVRLICFGLFEKENEDCLKKMVAFTKGYEQPTELLEEKVFPVMMEMLTANMMKNQERAWRYLQGSSGIRECWEGSRIELRNISNLSQLEVGSGWEAAAIDSGREEVRRSKFF